MDTHRLFILGIVLLFLGIQLRIVESVTFNGKASQFIEQRLLPKKSGVSTTSYVGYESYDDSWLGSPVTSGARKRTVTPPRWLGFSLISVVPVPS